MCGERKIIIVRLPPTSVANFREEEETQHVSPYVTMCSVYMCVLTLSDSVPLLFNLCIKGVAAMRGGAMLSLDNTASL